MCSFSKQYKRELEEEAMQFLIMCGKEDGKILILHNKETDLNGLARLACISLVFVYKKLFMHIATTAENNLVDFLNRLSVIDGNFDLLDEWLNSFIVNIVNDKVRKLASELWLARKQELDRNNFTVKLLL